MTRPKAPHLSTWFRPGTEIMETTMRFATLLVAVLLWTPSSGLASDPSPHQAFEQLKGLVGSWKSTRGERSTSVEIKLMANGSALVETWTMSPTRQSMTVYAMDGDRLLATHYCPQGNAPRLVFTGTDETGAHHFTFLDGTNLQDPRASHEHAFLIRADPEGTVTRTETYIANGAEYDAERDKGDTETFVRARR